MKKIEADDAISWLESGAAGSTGGAQAYFNPHLLVHTPERMEIEKQQYTKLLSGCETYAVNTGSVSIETIDKLILEKIQSYNLTDRT